jgi:hypothetical protein
MKIGYRRYIQNIGIGIFVADIIGIVLLLCIGSIYTIYFKFKDKVYFGFQFDCNTTQ